MKESLIETILNPVRMRILQALATGERLSVQMINDRLSDVPQATLYRHLNKLLAAGAIEVVEENQIRGTVEKVYSLAHSLNEKTQEEIRQFGPEGHSKAFFMYLMSLMGQFDTYIKQDEIDLKKDGLMYRSADLYMSDDEFMEYLTELTNLFKKYLTKKPTKERRQRTFANIIIPSKKI